MGKSSVEYHLDDDHPMQIYRILDHIHEAAFLIDENGRFHFANQQACRVLGYSYSELVGMAAADIDPDFPQERWPAHWQELKEKQTLTFESRHRTRDGRIFPVEINANYMEWNGRAYNLAMVRDITLAKEMAQTLLESEARYRNLADASFEAVMIHYQGTIVNANLAFARLFGYDSPDELIGRQGLDFLIHPSSRQAIQQRLQKTTFQDRIEVTGIRKDGSTFEGETQSSESFYMGKTMRVVAMRDITARKLAEATARQQALRAQILSDINQEINSEAFHFKKISDLAVRRCAEWIGDGASLFLYSPDSPVLELASVYNKDRSLRTYFQSYFKKYPIRVDEGAYGRVIQTNQPVLLPVIDMDRILANASPERKEYYERLPVYSGIFAPLRSEGKCIGIIGLGRHDPQHPSYTMEDLLFLQEIADRVSPGLVNSQLYGELQKELTERVHAENEVRRLNAELEQRVSERTSQLEAANKELEAFSYSVSHDLRAPLRAIRGYSKILLDENGKQLDASGLDVLDRVIKAAGNMNEKIDALLKLSRMIRVEIHPEKVDLSALVEAEIESFKAAEPGRQVTCLVTPGLVAFADRALIQVVLNNLLSNAWKYTSKKAETRIEFGLVELEDKKTYFIRDNGAGFDMAYSGKLFGTFERLHGESEFPGHGIGLATVKRVIQRHNGQIWAEAQPEQGATFYFTLPDPQD